MCWEKEKEHVNAALGTQAVLNVKQDSGNSAVTGFVQLCTFSCSTVFSLVVFTKGQHKIKSKYLVRAP